ncbi:MAG: Mur ligase domain-containing protein, partial [Angustibacter sp.]
MSAADPITNAPSPPRPTAPPAGRPMVAPRIRLDQLAQWLQVRPPVGDGVITGVTLDSRGIVPGDLYAALPGAQRHGASFG